MWIFCHLRVISNGQSNLIQNPNLPESKHSLKRSQISKLLEEKNRPSNNKPHEQTKANRQKTVTNIKSTIDTVTSNLTEMQVKLQFK